GPGQRRHGNFTVTQTADASGAPVVALTMQGVVAKLGGTATAPILTATQSTATATFLLTSAGIVGHVGATIAINLPSVSLSGSFDLKINTTGAAANGLPAGPYLRIEGNGVTLTALGQQLTASFTVEQATNAQGQKVLRV